MAQHSRRQDRVAEAVREEVATFLAEKARDPRITAMVTVTGVKVSRDLRHAVVYVSLYGPEDRIDPSMEGLRSLAHHLRALVGRNLRLRVAPEIQFQVDETAKRASRIEALLSEIKNADTADAPGNED